MSEHHHHDHEHHDHDHGCSSCGCACCGGESEFEIGERREYTFTGFMRDHRRDVIELAIGAVLFIAGVITEYTDVIWPVVLIISLVAYVILGKGVLGATVTNLKAGRIFDENFLMTVATIAAFCIGDFPEAAGIMLFYRIGEMFEDVSLEKSRADIAAAVDMRPETISLVRGDSVEEVPAEQGREGDIILVQPGDRIPLDGIVTEGRSIVDTSPVTGESQPVTLQEGDKVYSGCINMRGAIKLRVTAELGESMVSRILRSVEEAAASKPKIDKFITKFAAIYTPIVVILAAAVAILPPIVSIITGSAAMWQQWILTGITFLVISCPCAMVISVPLAYFLGIGKASGEGILFKSGLALEGLRKIKVVAFDKTGTITKGVVEDKGLLDADRKDDDFLTAFANKTVTGDEPKEDAASGISKLKKLGIKAAMLTGDKKDRAKAIGDMVGIEEKNIRSQLLPEDKLNALLGLREEHGPIMFVGDGINDAPVLAGADVGAAMGEGTDAAIEAADILFMNSNIEAVPRSFEIAGKTGRIAVENIVISLAIKLAVMALGLAGFANIWFAIFADTGVAMICILNSIRMLR